MFCVAVLGSDVLGVSAVGSLARCVVGLGPGVRYSVEISLDVLAVVIVDTSVFSVVLLGTDVLRVVVLGTVVLVLGCSPASSTVGFTDGVVSVVAELTGTVGESENGSGSFGVELGEVASLAVDSRPGPAVEGSHALSSSWE